MRYTLQINRRTVFGGIVIFSLLTIVYWRYTDDKKPLLFNERSTSNVKKEQNPDQLEQAKNPLQQNPVPSAKAKPIVNSTHRSQDPSLGNLGPQDCKNVEMSLMNQRTRDKSFPVYSADKHCPLHILKTPTKYSSAVPASAREGQACRRVLPPKSSCATAKRLFTRKPRSCYTSTPHNYCEVPQMNSSRPTIVCSTAKQTQCPSGMTYGIVNNATGEVNFYKVDSNSQLEQKLNDLVKSPDYRHSFCFIQCKGKGEQLFLLPPPVPPLKTKEEQQKLGGKGINVNIVLFDSLSHQHFFRSLPKTVEALEDINKNANSGATVFDFELVQAFRARTADAVRVLFSGDESIYSFSAMPRSATKNLKPPIKMHVLLRMFKEKGYFTLAQEDACPVGTWGSLPVLLQFIKNGVDLPTVWKTMHEELAFNSLDTIGAGLATCRVFKLKGLKHPLGAEPICFDGRDYDGYLLEQTYNYHLMAQAHDQRMFSFLALDTGHEGTGLRIQHIDKPLSEFVKNAAKLPNTLTVLFSDHGNTYGGFVSAEDSLEPIMEMHHPNLKFIVPDGVAAVLGDDAMKALEINKKRLVTFLDAHYTLASLVNSEYAVKPEHKKYLVSEKGLFAEVPASRHCDNVMVNKAQSMCICENSIKALTYEPGYKILAWVTTALINVKIQKQYRDSFKDASPATAFGRCQKLEISSLSYMFEFLEADGSVWYNMMMSASGGSFYAAFGIKPSTDDKSCFSGHLMMVDNFESWSKYAVCGDNIDMFLCICDTRYKYQPGPYNGAVPTLAALRPRPWSGFSTAADVMESWNSCLALASARINRGIFVTVVNICRNATVTFKLLGMTGKPLPIRLFTEESGQIDMLPGGEVPLVLVFAKIGDPWNVSIRMESHKVGSSSPSDKVSVVKEFKGDGK